MSTSNDRLKIAIFSGGRGTGSICDALVKYAQMELFVLVNAYDDGLSTGRIRSFVPGMLGPSDIRKNVSRLIPDGDRSSDALRFVLEYRLPALISEEIGIRFVEALAAGRFLDLPAGLEELRRSVQHLSLYQADCLSRFAEGFLAHLRRQLDSGLHFDFADCAVGNLLLAGSYCASGDFNTAVEHFSDLAGNRGRVLNVTGGESLILLGLKEDGRVLRSEAEIVARQDAVPILDIFLIPSGLDASGLAEIERMTVAEKLRYLRAREVTPRINPVVDRVLLDADIIIYGPGTQHSSLFPSYLTNGVAEAIAANRAAEKIFIANIRKDNEIQGETGNSLVRKALFYLSRKETIRLDSEGLVDRFFFQKVQSGNGRVSDYVELRKEAFHFPTERIVDVNWEGRDGVHSGGRVVDEIIAIVNAKAQRKLRPLPFMVSIIVPALNEVRTISKVLHELALLNLQPLGLAKEIILVDGGSTDGTFEAAQSEESVRCFHLEGNRGRGAAIRRGFAEARGDIIVTFPSDGEYNANDLVPIITAIARNEFRVVLGSRSIKCVNLSGRIREIYQGDSLGYLVSKYGGMLLSVVSLLLYNRFVSDPLTGVKALDRRLLESLALGADGVNIETEILAKLGVRREFILEVPVDYYPRTRKQGKKIRVGDGIKALTTLIRERWAYHADTVYSHTGIQ